VLESWVLGLVVLGLSFVICLALNSIKSAGNIFSVIAVRVGLNLGVLVFLLVAAMKWVAFKTPEFFYLYNPQNVLAK
jgi:hypothetical protein